MTSQGQARGSELTGASTIQPVATLWGQLPAAGAERGTESSQSPAWLACEPCDLQTHKPDGSAHTWLPLPSLWAGVRP